MKIESVTVTPIRLPLRSSVTWRSSSFLCYDNVLVELRTSDGVCGVAEATPRGWSTGETTFAMARAIERLLAPRLVGSVFADIKAVSAALSAVPDYGGARAAVEIAALDALARTLGEPCYRLLGGYANRMPVAAVLTFAEPEAVVDMAAAWQASHGIAHFKVKVGRDVIRDERTCRLLRSALPTATIYADANGGYDLDDALRFCDIADDLGLAYLEELIPVTRAEWRRRVAERSTITVLGDESCSTVETATDALRSGHVGGLSLKLNRTGPVGTSVLRSFCDAEGHPCVMGFESTSSVGVAASAAFGVSKASTATRAGELVSHLDLAADPRQQPLVIQGGEVVLDDRPGFGSDLDADVVARLSLRPR